ncbi:hypothetical protein C0W96_08600 [Photobacterium kishitanii]|uniref:TnsD family Tn7-like transposition protein n=1 Tax=Photobacterium kishitanii TaxID=318456 RepID=UPI0005D38EF5|nr:hypothetical protein UB40_20360 [Photobacterium kishitanii]PSV06511.1 hypothetical protein C0W96_08600 [Photobacterium kishitanii]PSV77394.1 hypothetical protein C0W29_02600 [Photobacterium kishitanii]
MHGIKLNLKPKQLNEALKHRIIRLARLGVHRLRISQVCCIGIGSIEQAIANVSGLVEWRKQCHWESKRRCYRVQVQRYRQRCPDALRRDIKADCNAAFFWLYMNDSDWLELALPPPTAARVRR